VARIRNAAPDRLLRSPDGDTTVPWPARVSDGSRPETRKKQSKTTQREEPSVPTIYKICSASAWREAERQGVYRGSEADLSDGFIHFSTAAQVESTARKHFAGQKGLFVIAIDADALGGKLRWEPARDGALFPHLYDELDLAAVIKVLDMPLRSDGSHRIPELAP
jgi:uncharacterized protein (DUF952 family)